jgi:hypothetical protein
MPIVQIGRRHRADYESDLRAVGLSSYTLIVDTQPNVLDSPSASSANIADIAQCAACNFLDFLAQVEGLERYYGLSSARASLPRAAPSVASAPMYAA